MTQVEGRCVHFLTRENDLQNEKSASKGDSEESKRARRFFEFTSLEHTEVLVQGAGGVGR